jgi:pyridoxamine 5'-phosphate oxidase
MSDPRSMHAPSGVHPDRTLDEDDLLADPIDQFLGWLDDAETEGIAMPHAMALATADAGGHPSVRHVLLRGVDARGFAFYTNRESRKGRDLSQNPHAAAVFLWKELDRQVTVEGRVDPLSDEESDAYFATRPRDAQIGAWASDQSRPIVDRTELDRRISAAEERFSGTEVPRPPYWGGYRLVPTSIEFWQGRAFRLHDRLRYVRDAGDPSGWRIERLAP